MESKELLDNELSRFSIENTTANNFNMIDGVLGCTVTTVSTSPRGIYHQFVGQT